jgi:2-methylcitrate dehydratase PrpD
MAAQYSVPYCAAVALTGDVTDPAAFLPGGLEEPAPRALIERIELYVDEEVERNFPERFGTKVDLLTRDGRRIERTLWYARGTPADASTEAELSDKFRKLCTGSATAAQTSAIDQAVRSLEASTTVSGLTAAIRAAGSREAGA